MYTRTLVQVTALQSITAYEHAYLTDIALTLSSATEGLTCSNHSEGLVTAKAPGGGKCRYTTVLTMLKYIFLRPNSAVLVLYKYNMTP